MSNKTQIERYKKLLSFIEANFKEDINIQKIENVCHYSYRNINRIFEALHHETIGKYIKRLRLEKAAQYLKYTEMGVSEIAYEVGFEDRAAFSKAFKNKYGHAPSTFRVGEEAIKEVMQQSFLEQEGVGKRQKLQYETAYLPNFDYLFLEHRGTYKDMPAIEESWEQLFDYTSAKGLVSDRSLFLAEIVDDNEISDSINARYNLGLIVERPIAFELDGFFRIKAHRRQKYAKFLYQGSHESSFEFYNKIYAFWMLDVALELEDLPVIEFYLNHHESTSSEELFTEIYIPVK